MKIDLLFLQASAVFFFVASIGVSLLLSNLLFLEYPIENWFTTFSRILFGISYLSILSFAFSLFYIFKFTRYVSNDSPNFNLSADSLIRARKGMITTAILLLFACPLIFLFAQADDAPGFAIVGILLVGTPLGFASIASLFKSVLLSIKN